MAKGMAWMTLFKFVTRSMGVVSTMILARLLVPEDFGLIAMASAVIAAIELLSAFSFDVALIQNQSATRAHYDSAWTLHVIFGVVLSGIIVLFSGVIADFFREPRLVDILIVLAIGYIVRSAENIAVVDLRKNLQFDREFLLRVSEKLVGFCITISLAYWLRSYWALVIGIVATHIAGVAMTYIIIPYRPAFNLQHAKDLFGFSKWLVINNFLAFFRERSADFILGRVSGATSLGLFTIGNEIASLPTTELVMPINRAVFPGYARMASEPDTLRQSYLEILGVIALIALPAGVGIASVAHLAVPVFLGDQWHAAIPIVQVMAIHGVFYALLGNTGPLLLALGKPQLLTIILAATVAALIPGAIMLSAQMGALGLAWAYMLAMPVCFGLSIYFVMVNIRLRIISLIGAIWRPVVASVLMYVILQILFPPASGEDATSLTLLGPLLAAIATGGAIYVTTVLGLWWLGSRDGGPERLALDFIKRKLPA